MEIRLTDTEAQTANKAYEKLGLANRLNILQEELGEAVAAVSHFRRGRLNAQSEFAEELADVLVVIATLLPQFEPDIMYWVHAKLERLSDRLKRLETIVPQ